MFLRCFENDIRKLIAECGRSKQGCVVSERAFSTRPKNSFSDKRDTDKVRESVAAQVDRRDSNGVTEERNLSGYCSELVRKHEYESFLCTLLLPGEELKSSVFAVRSFNVEIALIRDQVSQKEIGLGRLVFWRNAINKLFQGSAADIPRHPVAQELHRVLRGKTVSKKWFVNLMDARERVMNDAPFKNLEDLEGYCDKAVSPILYIGLETLGVKSVDVDHAASHLGKSIGLANFIRSISHNAQRRRVLIPQDLLLKHKLSQENFIRFTNKEGIQDAVFDIASQAHMHYEKAKALKSNIVKEALPLMLIGTPTEIYLKRLQNCQFNPYDTNLSRRYSLLPFHLYYRKLTRSYY